MLTCKLVRDRYRGVRRGAFAAIWSRRRLALKGCKAILEGNQKNVKKFQESIL